MQEAVFLFHVFFEICALKSLDKKCGQVDKLMRILKKTSVMSSSKSVNCVKETVFLLCVFFLSFKIQKKSVERWTSNENSEKKCFSLMYILIYKNGIYRQISLSETVFFISHFLSFLYPSNYFQMWTSSCFSILCVLSFVYLQNIFKKCGQVDNL